MILVYFFPCRHDKVNFRKITASSILVMIFKDYLLIYLNINVW